MNSSEHLSNLNVYANEISQNLMPPVGFGIKGMNSSIDSTFLTNHVSQTGNQNSEVQTCNVEDMQQ